MHDRFSLVYFRDGQQHDEEFTDRDEAQQRFAELEVQLANLPLGESIMLFGWLAGTGEPQLIRESWNEPPRRRRSPQRSER